MRPKNNKGFSLIELFIVTAIFFLVGIAVHSTFSNGLKVWRRCSVDRRIEQNIRINLTKIVRDVRNTFGFSKIPFEGDESAIFFPSLVSTSGEDNHKYNVVGRISYFFDKDEGLLCKEAKPYPYVHRNEEIEDEYVTSLISGVEELTFSYCYMDNATSTYKWKDTWKKEEQDTIPQAIKIEFVVQKDDERKEYSKVIFIPIGTGEQKIEIK